ncbi:ribonuclease VapC [Spirochaetia bacterium]|nr:ribonuclease VapC [Spirochaetia bacterium]
MVKYLLDTNVLSELQKQNRNPRVNAYIENIIQDDIFISVISAGEIAFGTEKLPEGQKKNDLSRWLYHEILEAFENRVVSLDIEVMLEWGRIRGVTKNPLPIIDSLIAAAALAHHLTLVTRNTRDFKDIGGLNLINPWD